MLRRACLILLIPLLAACATTEQKVATSDVRATAPSTRYRQGDFIVYRYSGAFSPAPVTLREEVRAQEGNRLRIDVTATRGAEERRWIQVLTDTPENQRNNVIDALYELIDGKPVKLENKDNRDAFRLYEWILVMPEGRATDLQQGPCERVLGGSRFACICTTGKNSWHGRAIHFEEAECPDFLWTHADGRFWDPSSGEDVHLTEIIDVGRGPGAAAPLVPSFSSNVEPPPSLHPAAVADPASVEPTPETPIESAPPPLPTDVVAPPAAAPSPTNPPPDAPTSEPQAAHRPLLGSNLLVAVVQAVVAAAAGVSANVFAYSLFSLVGPLLSVPLFGPVIGIALVTITLVLGGIGAGIAAGAVGDRFGPRRAPLIWPIVGGCVSEPLVAGGASVVVLGGSLFAIMYFGLCSGPDPERAVSEVGPWVLGGLGAMAVGSAFTPLAYWLGAEEKSPGDDGTAPSGIFEALPSAAVPPQPVAAAMRF